MRSFFQTLLLALFALFSFAAAQDYDTTVYVTSTVYRVNTVTLSGSPTASVANTTSTILPSIPSAVTPIYSTGAANGTVSPTGSASGPGPAVPTVSEFPGAASQLSINSLAAILAVGIGYLAL
jgi:hypothetical protein